MIIAIRYFSKFGHSEKMAEVIGWSALARVPSSSLLSRRCDPYSRHRASLLMSVLLLVKVLWGRCMPVIPTSKIWKT